MGHQPGQKPNNPMGDTLNRAGLFTTFQESYNTPLEHTPGNPPTQLWKDSLYNLLVKV